MTAYVPANTAFTTPQGWAGEFMSPSKRSPGFVWVEYQLWRSAAAKASNLAPFLLNNHLMQRRETHQRIVVGAGGGLVHENADGSRIAIAPAEITPAFYASDSRVIRWTQRDSLTEWRGPAGVRRAPFVFKSGFGNDEALDPQWLREQHTVSMDEQVMEAVLEFCARAQVKGWSGDRRGTTLNLAVSVGTDDAYERADDTNYVANQNIFAWAAVSSAARYHAAYRLQGVTIASAETIDTATCQVYPVTQDDPDLDIFCEDVDNTANFTTTADVVNRTKTATSATWNATNVGTSGYVVTPSCVDPVQTVINRAGFASGNAIMMMFWAESGGTTGTLTITGYDTNSARGGKLDIDHSAGGGGDPEGSLLQGKLIRGGLLRGGVLAA